MLLMGLAGGPATRRKLVNRRREQTIDALGLPHLHATMPCVCLPIRTAIFDVVIAEGRLKATNGPAAGSTELAADCLRFMRA